MYYFDICNKFYVYLIISWNNLQNLINSTRDFDITATTGVIHRGEFVDRSKVKEISKLIIERDAAKFGFIHLKVAKAGEPAPKKKKFAPKFIEIK